MQNQASLQETKQHGAVRFPFNLYPCTIPGDFQQVALHWHESMELVFVKQGTGLVQVGAVTYPAYRGDIFLFAPGTLHALRQAEEQRMEYENIIFEPELLGGAEDLCAEKYLLPLQSGRLSLPVRLTPNDLCYLQAAACLRELEDANRAKRPGYELLVKGALLRFLALLIAQGRQCLPTETADTQRLKTVLQWLSAHYAEPLRVADAAGVCSFSASHFMRWFRQMTGQSFIIYPACPARDEKSDDPPARVIAFSFIYKVRSPDGFPFRPPWAALSTTGAACGTPVPQPPAWSCGAASWARGSGFSAPWWTCLNRTAR